MIRSSVLIAGLVLTAGTAYAQERGEACREPITGWGTVGQTGGCTVRAGSGRVVFVVPPASEKEQVRWAYVNRPVEGDFTAEVKVTADWTVGGPARGSPFAATVHGGLEAWESDKNLLVWGRGLMRRGGDLRTEVTPRCRRDGKLDTVYLGGPSFFKGRSTWLRVTRTGDTFRYARSHDGREWLTDESCVVHLKMRSTVAVGVTVLNGTDAEFTVAFEDLRITRK